MDFLDSAWECSLLTAVTINFSVETTFTWHVDSWIWEAGLNYAKDFVSGLTVCSHIAMKKSHDNNLGEALQIIPFIYLVNTFNVGTKH